MKCLEGTNTELNFPRTTHEASTLKNACSLIYVAQHIPLFKMDNLLIWQLEWEKN